jgi:hypothetical protein
MLKVTNVVLGQYSEVTFFNSYAEERYCSGQYAQKYTITKLHNY